jgi:hypothetical protein
MVTISGYEERQGTDGKFLVLILQGEVEFVFSQKTGLPYANISKCSMPATFDEATCKAMVGKQMPGSIQKVQLDEPYEYTIPKTKEKVMLDYNFVYSPLENSTAEEAVFDLKEAA